MIDKPAGSNPWPDLIVAMLAVNSYSLEKVWANYDALAAAGVFDPERLRELGFEGIYRVLKESGYDRGEFMTKSIAVRLSHLDAFIERNDRVSCELFLRSADAEQLRSFLLGVTGIGPAVIRNYILLRDGG